MNGLEYTLPEIDQLGSVELYPAPTVSTSPAVNGAEYCLADLAQLGSVLL